jgi:hypothetical protein
MGKMRSHRFFFVGPLVLAVVMFGVMLAPLASADTLKTADNFAVLAGSTVTNAGVGVLGATVITGELGVYAGSACTGFVKCPVTGPGSTGTVHLADGVAQQAQKDLNTAYTTLGGLPVPPGNVLTGGILGGLNLGPGVYSAGAASLTGTLILNDGGVAGSQFVFLMSALTTSPDSKIDVSKLSPTDSLFWVVGSSAILGVDTVFEGNILALTDINFLPGATDLCGRALAETGQVTFAGQGPTSKIENQVSIGCSSILNLSGSNGLAGGTATGGGGGGTPVPEPGTLLLLSSGFAALGMARIRLAKARRA